MVMSPDILTQREKKTHLSHAYLVDQIAQRVKSRIPDHILNMTNFALLDLLV